MSTRDLYIRLLTETHHLYPHAALMRCNIQDVLAHLRDSAAQEHHLTDEQMQDHCEGEADRIVRLRRKS